MRGETSKQEKIKKLEEMTDEELLVLLKKQEELVKSGWIEKVYILQIVNIKFVLIIFIIYKLPDKGAKVLKNIESIKQLLSAHDALANSFSALSIKLGILFRLPSFSPSIILTPLNLKGNDAMMQDVASSQTPTKETQRKKETPPSQKATSTSPTRESNKNISQQYKTATASSKEAKHAASSLNALSLGTISYEFICIQY